MTTVPRTRAPSPTASPSRSKDFVVIRQPYVLADSLDPVERPEDEGQLVSVSGQAAFSVPLVHRDAAGKVSVVGYEQLIVQPVPQPRGYSLRFLDHFDAEIPMALSSDNIYRGVVEIDGGALIQLDSAEMGAQTVPQVLSVVFELAGL